MKNERGDNPNTALLYETDGLLMEFEAVVTERICLPEGKGYGLILDRTAFFPGGGGQESDSGYIRTSGGKGIRVTRAAVSDGKVIHYTEEPVDEGERITGLIDRKQRISRMQDHGAEHLISGLIHERFGYDNVGFHMSKDETVIDFNGPLSEEQIRQIEQRANEIICENVPVTVSFPSPKEAKALSYRSKLDLYENIRLVSIEGFDVCACCAPHLPSTGLFGSVMITSHMPHRGGTRMSLVAGINAYDDHSKLAGSNAKIMEMLSSPRYETDEFVKDMTDRMASLREENTELKRKLTKLVSDSVAGGLLREDPQGNGIRAVFCDVADMTGLRELVNNCTSVYKGVVCAFLKKESGFGYIFSVCKGRAQSAGLKELADDFNRSCRGKGGGSPLMVTGTTEAGREEIERFFAQKSP
ncbi:MAG: hypothetical protein IKO16_05460 [Lachnospiraceae bacterium]|nr:hypothetical protein [Lachnospiraceae bacterium]